MASVILSIRQLIIQVLNYIAEYFLICFSILFSPFGHRLRDEDVWVFSDQLNGGFSDNSKYLYLHLNNSDTECRPIWITSNSDLKTQLTVQGFEAYHTREWKSIYYLLQAGKITTSYGIPTRSLGLIGGATLIHLWHGVPLKSLKVSSTLPYHPRSFLEYDFAVANSNKEEEALRKIINFERLLVAGYPRNDIHYRDFPGEMIGVDTESHDKLRELDCDLVFGYFPTGRKYDTQIPISFDDLSSELKKMGSYLIISPHPHQEFKDDLDRFERIIVHPSSGDLYPLFKYIDVMLVDYSSIYFDFLHLNRPIIFYPFDLQTYSQKRGFYLDYESVSPGYMAYSFDDLVESLNLIRYFDPHQRSRSNVCQQVFEYRDGKSSQRIVEAIRENT